MASLVFRCMIAPLYRLRLPSNSDIEGTSADQENKLHPMTPNENSPHAYRVADLPTKRQTRFAYRPDANERSEIAKALGLQGLKKLSFTGEISPLGRRDWRLTAKLGASITQGCVVTLEPVNTRIDAEITREFHKELGEPTGDEFEMPEDDTVEELGDFIDPYLIMQESLAIEMPDYPRSPTAEAANTIVTEPGKAAMTDDDAKPFAVLADLLKSGGNPQNEG